MAEGHPSTPLTLQTLLKLVTIKPCMTLLMANDTMQLCMWCTVRASTCFYLWTDSKAAAKGLERQIFDPLHPLPSPPSWLHWISGKVQWPMPWMTWFDMKELIWYEGHNLIWMTWFDMIWEEQHNFTWMTWFDTIWHNLYDLTWMTWFDMNDIMWVTSFPAVNLQ
jgi:hypothetical protein